MAAPMEDMEEIYLIGSETNKEFKIIISSNDATRARNDLTFATHLLQHAKHSTQEIGYTSPQASTSNNSQQELASVSLNTTAECQKGAHAWTKQESVLLLELYRQHQTKFIGGKGTIKKHWDNIASLMQEKGHNINGFKCSTKFQSLKRTYKSIMDHNKKSDNNRKDWEFLQIMQELFGEKSWVQTLAITGLHLDEKQNENNLPAKENIQEEVTKKTKLNTVISDYISFSKEERAKRRESRA